MPIYKEELPFAINFGASLLIKYLDPLNTDFTCSPPFFCVADSGMPMLEINNLTKPMPYEAFAGLFLFQFVW